jgi:hypothetical protein
MLTLNGSQIRRLEFLWLDAKQEPIYLVETWEPRRSCTTRQSNIKASGGVAEILEVAKFKGGQILEQCHGDSLRLAGDTSQVQPETCA